MDREMNDNISEADFMENGADYLEEYQCEPCTDCGRKECSAYCPRYDEWFWNR